MTDPASLASPGTSLPASTPVHTAIARASAASGVDFAYLLGQARLESGLNPAARAATSSASGLYQFTRQTWLATVKRHGPQQGLGWAAAAISQTSDGRYHVTDPAIRASVLALRDDADAASAMAAAFARDNSEYLTARLNAVPQGVDLYLAHFLGAAGAARFLEAHAQTPDAAAAPLFPAAASANRAIFFADDGSPRSLAAIRDRFAAKLDDAALTDPALAPALFAASWASGAAIPAAATATTATQATEADGGSVREHRPMFGITPMPGRLSIDFARAAYRRLDSLSAGKPA